jgi:hypothetical protein
MREKRSVALRDPLSGRLGSWWSSAGHPDRPSRESAIHVRRAQGCHVFVPLAGLLIARPWPPNA